jgi:hypothetical protein
VKLHPIPPHVKCPHCGRGPLEFVRLYRDRGDRYRCTSCKSPVIHCRRKATIRCFLIPLPGSGIFGTWKEHWCESAEVGVGATKQEAEAEDFSVGMLHDLQQACELVQAGKFSLALTPLRRVLRNLDRLLHSGSSEDNRSQTCVLGPEQRRASIAFLFCQCAASALVCSPPDTPNATRALKQAILDLKGDQKPRPVKESVTR